MYESEVRMEYQDFVEQVQNDLKKEMPEAEIFVRHIEKFQGQSYDGIMVMQRDSNVSPALNPVYFYQGIEEGKDYQAVFSEIMAAVKEGGLDAARVDETFLLDYSRAKEHLTVELIAREGNMEKLNTVPHMDMEDLALVYRIDLKEMIGEKASVVVSNDVLRNYGISKEQLHLDAIRNAAEIKPAVLERMEVILARSAGLPEPGEEVCGGLYVAFTHPGDMGASVIVYPEFLEKAANVMGGNYFILPSSRHDVVLVPDDGRTTYQALENYVYEVNRIEVPPVDRLSDSVYHYDCNERVFELAEKYESRKQDREAPKRSVLDDLAVKKEEAALSRVDRPVGKKEPEYMR